MRTDRALKKQRQSRISVNLIAIMQSLERGLDICCLRMVKIDAGFERRRSCDCLPSTATVQMKLRYMPRDDSNPSSNNQGIPSSQFSIFFSTANSPLVLAPSPPLWASNRTYYADAVTKTPFFFLTGESVPYVRTISHDSDDTDAVRISVDAVFTSQSSAYKVSL
jgi:hypothetical protein